MPITLRPVDGVHVTTLIDNSCDALLPDEGPIRRWGVAGTAGRVPAISNSFAIIEDRQPSFLLDGMLLVTGEVDRTTDFEIGMPGHQVWRDNAWQPDQLIQDDQAIVLHVRDKGLVKLTGCGHAGIVNIIRYAKAKTGIDQVYAAIGGFHLRDGPIIPRTVAALTAEAPAVLVPAHCTSWKGQHALAAGLPDAFRSNSVGSRFEL